MLFVSIELTKIVILVSFGFHLILYLILTGRNKDFHNRISQPNNPKKDDFRQVRDIINNDIIEIEIKVVDVEAEVVNKKPYGES